MADVKKQTQIHSKADVVDQVASLVDKLSKTAVGEVIDALLETIKKLVASDKKVTFVGFGTFERSERKARTGRNPQTGKEIKIAAAKVPKFRAGKGFKDAVDSK